MRPQKTKQMKPQESGISIDFDRYLQENSKDDHM